MSFYNLINGVDSQSNFLLALLGLTRTDVPRFRDCYWNGEEICIYTRTGGGNRDYYESLESCKKNYPEDFTGDNPPKGPWNDDLRKMPTFKRDEDDSFDSTYATFFFALPEVFSELKYDLKAADATPQQKFESFLERLYSGKTDPQIERVEKVMAPIIEKIKKMTDENKDK